MALEEYVAAGKHHEAIYGDGLWGPSDALRAELVQWIEGSALPGITALEIGCGGGRWTRYYCHRVGLAWLVDGTPAAEEAVLSHCDGPLKFVVSIDGGLPMIPVESIDWCWSFDTFVHFHSVLFDDYVRSISTVLKPGGLFHLHYAVAWPGLAQDQTCFLYRDEGEVTELLCGLRLHATGRRIECRGGFGSLMQEFRKA